MAEIGSAWALPNGWTCATCEQEIETLYVCARCGAFHCVGCNDSEGLCKACVVKCGGGKVTARSSRDSRPSPLPSRENDNGRRMGRDVSERNFQYGF
jgi:hypothetical protein